MLTMWPWHHDPNWFVAPPCNCAEIEGHVRAAIAVRDEMATWPTPLEAWKALQQMPVLELKTDMVGQPPVKKPPTAVATFENWDPWPLRQRYVVPMKIRLKPGENYEVGTVLVRGSLRFKVVERLFDNTNCVMVKSLRG